MRQLLGIGFLIVGLVQRIAQPTGDRTANLILALLVGMGLFLLLPAPQDGSQGGPGLWLFRLYLLGRVICGAPMAIIGGVMIYFAFFGEADQAVESRLPTAIFVLLTGALCLSAGTWLAVTSTRAFDRRSG